MKRFKKLKIGCVSFRTNDWYWFGVFIPYKGNLLDITFSLKHGISYQLLPF